MKKLSVFLFILLFSVPVFSQFIKFGIKAGAESNKTPEYNISFAPSIFSNYIITPQNNTSWGFHGGIFTRIKIQMLYIQPEVIFASNSYDYEVANIYHWSSAIYPKPDIKSQKFNRLSVPILVGMEFGPVRINAGPVAAIQIGSPKALIDDPNFKKMYKDAVWGFQAGIGFDILETLTLDFRYAGSLGERYGNEVTIGNQNYKLDHGQKSFLVSIGLMF